ncbi:MAG: magnesium transport protein CorA [Firmicutes bacterium]|nr:magnesium transport protein CorA [Bacillota bacterium]
MAKFTRGMGRKAGLPPGSLLHIGDNRVEKVTISVMDYDASGVREENPKTVGELLRFKNTATVTWINIIGLHDIKIIERIGSCFDIHPLVLEDILDTNHRPKLEDYGHYLYIVLKSFVSQGGDNPEIEQISIIIGENYVITFQEQDEALFNTLRERIRSEKARIRTLGADYLAYALLDTVVDNYFDVLEALGETIEDLEDKLVIEPGRNAMQEIHNLKRRLLNFKKSLWPLREVMGTLGRGESPLVNKATLLYVRDVYDHTIRVIDTLETYRDILSGMLDMYLSGISIRMNQVMKVLTVISTVFIPLTFIVGVYGMNFKYMPELDWEWGYPAIWVVMLLISATMLALFRRRKWL